MDEILVEAFGCFVLECDELLQKAVDSTLEIEGGGGSESIDSLLRALHTIKGNARMFELKAIPAIAHAAESLAARLRRDGLRPDRAEASLLLESFDAIKSRVASVAAGAEEEAAPPGLIAALESARGEEPAALAGVPPPAASPVPAAPPRPAAPPASAKAGSRAGEASRPAPLRAEGGHQGAQGRRLSILLVDDDFLQRRASERILARYGNCAVASGGGEAVEAVARSLEPGAEPFDLIVVDLVMPGMDGFEVVRSIRSLEMASALEALSSGAAGVGDLARKDSRILVASVLDDPASYMKACFRCGADGYLLKPVDSERLEVELGRMGLA